MHRVTGLLKREASPVWTCGLRLHLPAFPWSSAGSVRLTTWAAFLHLGFRPAPLPEWTNHRWARWPPAANQEPQTVMRSKVRGRRGQQQQQRPGRQPRCVSVCVWYYTYRACYKFVRKQMWRPWTFTWWRRTSDFTCALFLVVNSETFSTHTSKTSSVSSLTGPSSCGLGDTMFIHYNTNVRLQLCIFAFHLSVVFGCRLIMNNNHYHWLSIILKTQRPQQLRLRRNSNLCLSDD